MKGTFKTIVKWIAYSIGGSLVIALLLALGAWLKYSSIVNEVPKKEYGNLQPGQYGKYVNTFIGTGGFPAWVCGQNFPGATVPFGMVRLSPETISIYKDTKAYNNSGYYYGDNRMLGFSHTRLAGTGATDGGHFLFTPTTTIPQDIAYQENFYHHFSHADEIAFPGYYSIKFKDENILSELTATERSGLHRYTFPKDSKRQIIIKVTNAMGDRKAQNGKVTIDTEQNEVFGSVRTFGTFASRYKGVEVFFTAQFDRSFTDYGIWDGNTYKEGAKRGLGDQLTLNLGFNEDGKSNAVNVKVGISYTSVENARSNLESEVGDHLFDEIVDKAKDNWEAKLSKIKVEGGSEEESKIFYSALYRSFQMPTIFNDVNGDYLGFDNQIHQVTDYTYYTDLSLWDTFRTVHPLYSLIARDEQRDMMVSLVQMARQGGVLPRWPSGNGYTGSMLGSPADITITEAYLKGIRNFDIEFAFSKMKEVALAPPPKDCGSSGRRDIEAYIKYGYCPEEMGDKSVGKTLEYAWADYAISLLAQELGYVKDYDFFSKQSKNYRNVWNPKTQYFQSRRVDGSFVEKFDPLQLTYTDEDREYTKGYVEGSAWQWRWAVPYDAKGLIELFGDNDFFVQELNTFFERSDPRIATLIPDNYYWHGNEPDIHAVYLFNDAGRPDLTQQWVRWIMDNKYEDHYVGLDGNDDAGTLSAWYIFSSLGLYPIAGTDIYQLGSPLFRIAELNLGKSYLKIITDNYSRENKYVKEVFLNDKPIIGHSLIHAEIANGGIIRFVMCATPNGIL